MSGMGGVKIDIILPSCKRIVRPMCFTFFFSYSIIGFVSLFLAISFEMIIFETRYNTNER